MLRDDSRADATEVNNSDTPGLDEEHEPDLASLCALLA